MRTVRLVTILVGYVTGLDCLTVRGDIGHGSLEHGHWSFRTRLQVRDLLLLDSVIGLETAILSFHIVKYIQEKNMYL